jgi:hypothetical protein
LRAGKQKGGEFLGAGNTIIDTPQIFEKLGIPLW